MICGTKLFAFCPDAYTSRCSNSNNRPRNKSAIRPKSRSTAVSSRIVNSSPKRLCVRAKQIALVTSNIYRSRMQRPGVSRYLQAVPRSESSTRRHSATPHVSESEVITKILREKGYGNGDQGAIMSRYRKTERGLRESSAQYRTVQSASSGNSRSFQTNKSTVLPPRPRMTLRQFLVQRLCVAKRKRILNLLALNGSNNRPPPRLLVPSHIAQIHPRVVRMARLQDPQWEGLAISLDGRPRTSQETGSGAVMRRLHTSGGRREPTARMEVHFRVPTPCVERETAG